MEFARRLRASLEDFAHGDTTSTLAIWAPDIRWFAVGQNPVAGKYVGHEDTLEYLRELSRLSGGTYRWDILEVRPMFGRTYVARFRNVAQAGDLRLDVPSSLIVDSDGSRVVSVVEVHHNEAAWDAFWTAAATADRAYALTDTGGHGRPSRAGASRV